MRPELRTTVNCCETDAPPPPLLDPPPPLPVPQRDSCRLQDHLPNYRFRPVVLPLTGIASLLLCSIMFSKGLVLSACYPKLSKFCLIYEFVSCIEYQTQHLCIFKTKIVDSLPSYSFRKTRAKTESTEIGVERT
uniref:Uncharacterized protein n=1 Tax=Helianthus annuus TaxID=4232 RepID=A0A251VIW9_HELAN